MRTILLSLPVLLLAVGFALADDMATCTSRHAELTKAAATFQGDPQIKRLIDADLKRAMKEQAEGDAEECIEALDHAAKLLAGEV
jgi:hypothetical protein